MKLLALFGLALVVVAIKSKHLRTVVDFKPEIHLKLLKFTPSSPILCSRILLMVYYGRVKLETNQEVIPPLVTYCLETRQLLPRKALFELDITHLAALIIMLRVSGEAKAEKAAECLYNIAIYKYCHAQTKNWSYRMPYEPDSIRKFQQLTEEYDKRFSMLRTVQMYGDISKSRDASQKTWLWSSELAALNLMSMGIPPEVLIREAIRLPKKLPVGVTLDLLPSVKLMFFSLAGDEYLRLQKPERAQLLVFLERYFKYAWNKYTSLTKKLPKEELEQFEEAFKLEDRCKCWFLVPDAIPEFARHFCNAMWVGCPVFLLKKMFDFYLQELPSMKKELPSSMEEESLHWKKLLGDIYGSDELPSAKGLSPADEVFAAREKVLGKRYCLLEVLYTALTAVRKWERRDRKLVCGQIKRTILECELDICKSLAELSKDNPKGLSKGNLEAREKWREEWERHVFRKDSDTTFKAILKGDIPYADFELPD